MTAAADITQAVNDARIRDCRVAPDSSYRLRRSPVLDVAARRLSAGEPLDTATRHAGYRALNSAAVQITNVPDDRDVARIVGQRFCAQMSDSHLRDIGSYRRGADVWLLVATPFDPPGTADRRRISLRVLELTNAARAQPRRCGPVMFQAAPPLTLAPVLERAAAAHSADMAAHGYMDHTGRDGTSPAQRISRTGYQWRLIGENLASGIPTPEEVVKGWVGSPHHCENLMDPRFTQMAVAYAVNLSSPAGIYWTQLFGTPMKALPAH